MLCYITLRENNKPWGRYITDQRERLLAEAARIRESHCLGRSTRLSDAFELLVSAGAEGRALKEAELAALVFSSDVRFSGGMDSSVRVLVHRMRKKLDEFYAANGAPGGERLDVPKGAYRLVLVPLSARVSPARLPDAGWFGWMRGKLKIGAFGLVGVALLAVAGTVFYRGRSPQGVTTVQDVALIRDTRLWHAFLQAPKPRTFVIGVVSPPEDLPDEAEPADAGSIPLAPLAAVFGVRNLTPLLHQDRPAERFALAVASNRLQPEEVRSSNVIYVGLLRDIGPQLAPLLNEARFVPGGGSAVILDRKTGRQFEGAGSLADLAAHTEYALLSAVNGLEGNRVVVIAGTGNAGLSQATSLAVNRTALDEVDRLTGGAENFEALYAVRAHGSSHQGAQLLIATARPATAWGLGTK